MDIYVFLELYDEVFQMWALSRMKSWILYRLRSAQKYPHFEGFSIDQTGWLKFRIFYHIWTHFGYYMCITCRRLQSVGRFRERFIPKQSLSIFKVVIFKWNLTIIVLITKERWIMVCFSVIETQRKVQRSTQEAQRSTSLLGIWNVSNYIYSKVWPRNFLEDCLSQNRADCASEDCLSHR